MIVLNISVAPRFTLCKNKSANRHNKILTRLHCIRVVRFCIKQKAKNRPPAIFICVKAVTIACAE